MRIDGRWSPPYSIEEVWAVLNDPDVLARCTPGCQRLEPIDDNRFRIDLKVSVAGIGGHYQATLEKVDVHKPNRYGLQVEGTGPIGAIKAAGSFNLTPTDTGTVVDYAWDVQIGGAMAGVVNRVLGGVSKMMLNRFFSDLESELSRRAFARERG